MSVELDIEALIRTSIKYNMLIDEIFEKAQPDGIGVGLSIGNINTVLACLEKDRYNAKLAEFMEEHK